MKRLVAALAVILSTASIARAEIPNIMREGTHGMWAAGTMGVLAGIRDAKFNYQGITVRSDAPTQFGLFQTFGYHFSGKPTGPAIAIDLQEGLGGDSDSVDIEIAFALVPKFVWDFRIIPGLGLYLSPMGGLGFMTVALDCNNCDNWNGFTFQFGFEGKLILADRGMVFFRPFHLEFDIMKVPSVDEWGTYVRYGLLFGGGAIF